MFFAEVAKATFFLFVGCLLTSLLDRGCAPCASLSPAKLCFTDRAASLGTLGLEGNATLRDVQRAYTTLARQYHPDKAGESEIEVSCNRPFTAKSDEPSLTDIFCCARALFLQHWRLVSGSYECLKVVLKSTSVTSDAMEIQLYPDSQEPVSAAHQEHSSVLEDRAVFTRRFRNASSALLTAETEVAAWNTLGQTLLDIDKIGR
jgi:DnaJ domain